MRDALRLHRRRGGERRLGKVHGDVGLRGQRLSEHAEPALPAEALDRGGEKREREIVQVRRVGRVAEVQHRHGVRLIGRVPRHPRPHDRPAADRISEREHVEQDGIVLALGGALGDRDDGAAHVGIGVAHQRRNATICRAWSAADLSPDAIRSSASAAIEAALDAHRPVRVVGDVDDERDTRAPLRVERERPGLCQQLVGAVGAAEGELRLGRPHQPGAGASRPASAPRPARAPQP